MTEHAVVKSIRRIAQAGLSLFLLAAAGPEHAHETPMAPPPGTPRADRDHRMFEFLTQGTWCGHDCGSSSSGMEPTCPKIRFRRYGAYRDWAFSDYLERDEIGLWNFVMLGDSSGILFPGGERVVRIRRHAKWLEFNEAAYELCPDQAPAPDSMRRTCEELPAVSAPRTLDSLCAHAWFREGEGEVPGYPQTMSFAADLTYRFTYSARWPSRGGTYSMGPGQLVLLYQPPAKNGSRPTESETSDYPYHLHGDTLEFGTRRYVAPGARRR
jgi:hypothetical protein